jgi:hypothetical protein
VTELLNRYVGRVNRGQCVIHHFIHGGGG